VNIDTGKIMLLKTAKVQVAARVAFLWKPIHLGIRQ